LCAVHLTPAACADTRADLDPAFATREILLADNRDGKPLHSREGPFRVVAPGDKRPGRRIRQVTTLRIIVVK